jgi:manganese/zinc/iron transport system substrate-binding protein
MNIKYLITGISAISIIAGFGLYYKINALKKEQQNKKKIVVCTTTMLGDTIQQIVKESIEIEVLMKPGVDPHTYKAIEPDLIKIAQADAIIYHGLHLEARMADLFAHLSYQKKTYAVTECIDHKKLICADESCQLFDPHVWLNPELWLDVAQSITKIVCELVPDNAHAYIHNLDVFTDRIMQAHQANKARIESIPLDQRILITSHDAFSYFAKCYDFQVMSLQGINTASESGIADVTKIVDFIIERKVPTIFIESSIPAKTMLAIEERVKEAGHQVKIGEELYSDSLSGLNGVAKSYIDMITYNVDAIVKGLIQG